MGTPKTPRDQTLTRPPDLPASPAAAPRDRLLNAQARRCRTADQFAAGLGVPCLTEPGNPTLNARSPAASATPCAHGQPPDADDGKQGHTSGGAGERNVTKAMAAEPRQCSICQPSHRGGL